MSDEKDSSDPEETGRRSGDGPDVADGRPDEEQDAPPIDEAEGEASERLARDEDIWVGDAAATSDAEDEIDPELLALGEEKSGPKWHRPIVMVVVCVLIVVMMVWFRHDLAYFFSPSEPIDLGEAHDIEFDQSWENRHVRFSGMPLAPSVQNPAPRCGRLQGFPTYQRRFLCRGHHSAIPLMGRPEHDLVVQRYVVRKLRVYYTPAEGQEDRSLDLATRAVLRVAAVHKVEPVREGELGRLIADIQGSPGRTDLAAVSKSIKFQIEASVPGVERVRVERDRRDPPGAYEGRLVRMRDLGTRFSAVAEFLNDCTNYTVDQETWVVLDGSEGGAGLFDGPGMCYGQAPRQYWPYLVLYLLLGAILVLNFFLLVRFFRGLGKD